MLKLLFWVALAVFSLFSFHASADETYEYDALGRLTKVTQEDGSVVDYVYDPAGNRTSMSVTGSGASQQDPNGPSAIVVVPLNGFTLIVVG